LLPTNSRVGNYQGVIITDDLVMGAIYNHDICTAVVEAGTRSPGRSRHATVGVQDASDEGGVLNN
jgi:hypothetical protein